MAGWTICPLSSAGMNVLLSPEIIAILATVGSVLLVDGG
jgi:hypothetical protein